VKKKYVPSPDEGMQVALAPFNPAMSRQIHAGIFMDTTDQTHDASDLMAEFRPRCVDWRILSAPLRHRAHP